jgi:hypothetical protein
MIFTDNKYTRCYFSIVHRALSRTICNFYSEKHHIIPKSLGGSNDKNNIVSLTAKEHFVCHRLLTKMVNDPESKTKMHHAVFQMTISSKNQNRYKITSRVYAILKQNKSLAMAGNKYGRGPTSEATKLKISQAKKGKSVNKGKSISVEQRQKLSAALKGRQPWNKGLTYNHKSSLGSPR